jgi:hypothetical protein
VWLKIALLNNLTILIQYLYFQHLTFTGPCIVIYSYSKSQQDALFLNSILVKISSVSERLTVHHQES